MPNIVILGTGMAGFGAAYRLYAEGIAPVMYDKNTYHGGHTASFRSDSGFLFDVGPHISFTKDSRIQDLFAESVEQQYETLQINLNNYWRGYWPQHPVQLHLHGLPEDIIVKVIADFVAERQIPERPVKNYADWLLASFGRTFAETFPMQYTRKYHLTTAENMSTDWLGPRIYRPSLEEVLRGAISPSAPHVHYITHFRYPSEGGFVSYLKKFVPLGKLKLNHELVSIEPRARNLRFSNGHITDYEGLISSVPLPDLVRMIHGTPQDVLEASRRLACSTCVLVNLGVDREDLSSAHMTYFYDEDICFTRIGFPHMLSTRNAPRGQEVFKRKFTSVTNTGPSPVHQRIGLNPSSKTCAAVASCAKRTVSCPARQCCFGTPTSSLTSIVRLHSKRSMAISMISVSPIVDVMGTGATCGPMRVSRAGSLPQNGP